MSVLACMLRGTVCSELTGAELLRHLVMDIMHDFASCIVAAFIFCNSLIAHNVSCSDTVPISIPKHVYCTNHACKQRLHSYSLRPISAKHVRTNSLVLTQGTDRLAEPRAAGACTSHVGVNAG